ncbi:MAG: hypothetical protein HXS42_05940 [Theionarchaea archaeon]|nr:hypothetical protein [Theionarchaea archaeon]
MTPWKIEENMMSLLGLPQLVIASVEMLQIWQSTESMQPGSTIQTPPSPGNPFTQWVLAVLIVSPVIGVAILMSRKILLRRG